MTRTLFAVTLMTAVLAAPWAGAHEAVCTGEWVMQATPLPIGNQPVSGGFAMVRTTGLCTSSSDLLGATGTVTGTCLDVVGDGWTSDEHRFFFTGAQGALVFSGEVTGTTTWLNDVFAGSNCSRFIVAGALALMHPVGKPDR